MPRDRTIALAAVLTAALWAMTHLAAAHVGAGAHEHPGASCTVTCIGLDGRQVPCRAVSPDTPCIDTHTLQEAAMPRAAARIARLVRDSDTVHGTLGRLRAADGSIDLHTMEPPWRDNARGRSCIPVGDYDVVPHVSPRYGRCYLIAGTAPRTHILVHAGNVGGDVEGGWHTHTLGCVLPGLRRGWLTVRGQRQRAVLASRTATRHLMQWAGGEPWRLEVRHAG